VDFKLHTNSPLATYLVLTRTFARVLGIAHPRGYWPIMTMILRERVRQPGRYGEVEEEHLPSPAKFVHETVPFNPNLPPARFPTLDHPPPKHSETTKGLYQGKEILTVANANMTDVNIMALTEKKSNGPKGSMKSTPPRSTGSDQHSMILGPISIPDEDLELRFEEIDKRPKTFHSERKAPSSTAPQRDQSMDRQELYEIHHRAPSRPYAATDNEYDLMHFPSTEFHPEDMVGLRTGLTASTTAFLPHNFVLKSHCYSVEITDFYPGL